MSKSDKVFWFLAVVVVVAIFLVTWNGIYFPQLPLKKIENIDLVSIFSGTLIIIALIERSIEVLIPRFEKPSESKDDTRDKTLYIGLIMGLFASLVGIRILEPLVEMDSIIDMNHKNFFIACDIIFSAMGIATGSQLFHIFPSLTSSVLESAKEQSEANMESAFLQKEQSKLDRMPIELKNKASERDIEMLEKQTEELRSEKIQQEIISIQSENELRKRKIESIRLENELQRENSESLGIKREIQSEKSLTADLSEEQNQEQNQK